MTQVHTLADPTCVIPVVVVPDTGSEGHSEPDRAHPHHPSEAHAPGALNQVPHLAGQVSA